MNPRVAHTLNENQRGIVCLYLLHKRHKEIARELGRTPSGVRRVLRNLSEQGRLPERHQWPVPRP